MQTGLYDASYGRNAGASVAIVTRSGGSTYHGGVYEFFRNEVLNSNNFFFNNVGKSRPILRQNQFGEDVRRTGSQEQTVFFHLL